MPTRWEANSITNAESVEASCPLGSRSTHLVSASLPPKAEICLTVVTFLWCTALVPGLLLPQSRSTVGSPSPLRTWCFGKLVLLHTGQTRFSFSLLVEDKVTASAPASLRVCCFPLCPLLQGHLNRGLCCSCHLKKPLWITQRKITSWMFITYMLHILC